MASESDPALRRVPSLVSYCQRGEQPLSRSRPAPVLTPSSPFSSCRWYVLSSLLLLDLISPAAITCLGDDVRYDVVKPVLECCSADTLLRLEQSSPVSPSRFSTASSLILDAVSRTRHLRHVTLQRQIRFLSPLTRHHQISGNVSASSPTPYLPNNSHEVSTNNLNPGAISILYVPVPYRPRTPFHTPVHSFFARPRPIDLKRSHQGSETSAWRQLNERENERSN